MAQLNDAARVLIDSGSLAHLVTINSDGSPQVSGIWVRLDGDELVSGHLQPQQLKMRNMARDPRVVLSFQTPGRDPSGFTQYLVLHAEVRLTQGGAPELLHELAQTYIGPGTPFPPMPDPPPGVVAHYRITKITGMGDWSAPEQLNIALLHPAWAGELEGDRRDCRRPLPDTDIRNGQA